MRRTGTAAALALAGLWALTAPALGATVSGAPDPRFGGTRVNLAYDAAPGEANRLTLGGPATTPAAVEVRDPGAVITPGRGCTRVDDHTAVCSTAEFGTLAGGPAEFSRVVARLRDGDDQAASALFGPATLLGQAGADVLRGGDGADVLDGGAGRDDVAGGAGADVLAEGDERDRDELGGGPGPDLLDYRGRRRPVTVDLPRARGADGDRLRSVENVRGGTGPDRLVGNTIRNRLEGAGGNDSIRGGRGTDFLAGGAGRDVLACGTGGDFVERPGRADRIAPDCERVIVEGRRPARFRLSVSQPLRAGRSGTVELRIAHAGSPQDPSFGGRATLRFRGLLLGRPSPPFEIAPGRSAVARVDVVDAGLSRLIALRRITVEVVINDAAFSTVLRAPLAPRGGTGGGTPA